jgi:hypothetical protein
MKMEQTGCSETSAYKIQTPGNYPEESIQHSEEGESLKSRMKRIFGWLPVTSPCRLRRLRSGQIRTMGRHFMVPPETCIDPCLALVSFVLFSVSRGLIISRAPFRGTLLIAYRFTLSVLF